MTRKNNALFAKTLNLEIESHLRRTATGNCSLMSCNSYPLGPSCLHALHIDFLYHLARDRRVLCKLGTNFP